MAVKVTREFTATVRGTGKPDYSRTISSGRERAGLALEYGQRLMYLVATFTDQVVVPYINPTIQAPLVAGASSHLIDPETGLAGPITIPAGYTGALVQWEWNGDGDIEMWHYIEVVGTSVLAGCPGISGPGTNMGWNMVIPPSTEAFDAEALLSHEWDVEVINRGVVDFEGTIDFIFLLDPVGTQPFPKDKRCKCPFCGNEQVTPMQTTMVKCNQCGKDYLLWDLSRFKRTP